MWLFRAPFVAGRQVWVTEAVWSHCMAAPYNWFECVNTVGDFPMYDAALEVLDFTPRMSGCY